MNPAYRRDVLPAQAKQMRRWELAILAVWGAGFGLAYVGVVPLRTLAVWYGRPDVVSFVNTLRVLGAHEYETDGQPAIGFEQLQDSIDTPGGPWTRSGRRSVSAITRSITTFRAFPTTTSASRIAVSWRRCRKDRRYRESTSPSLRHR